MLSGAPQILAQTILDTLREPILVLDRALRVNMANRSFYRTFRVQPEETEDKLIYDLGDGQWNIPKLRLLLQEVHSGDMQAEDFEVECEFPGIGRRFMILNARRIERETGQPMSRLKRGKTTGRTKRNRHFLTAREREVVQLLAEEKSNKEIAASLSLSVHTVETHRSNVMRKLGTHSLSGLIRYAVRIKIVQF